MRNKNTVIISAINFFEGGPLSILKDCLAFLNNSQYIDHYRFIALVHKLDLFDKNDYANIEFIEFPKSRSSYLYRLYYEYFYFKNFAKEKDVFFWFSLHDVTPSLSGVSQAVYCHNASPFNTINIKDLYFQPTQIFFRLLYKFLYRINIHKNKYVIVQQLWIKQKFIELFELERTKVIVSPPHIPQIPLEYINYETREIGEIKTFFYPTFPRPFKNIEVICEAAKLVAHKNLNFKIIITIDGTENKYSKMIFNKYKDIKNVEFIGLIKREEVYRYYALSDCLIFPSKLETWGLPISEFKQFSKPIFVSDMDYAKGAVGKYDMVNFFNPNKPIELSELILGFLNGKPNYAETKAVNYEQPYALGWDELFKTLLN